MWPEMLTFCVHFADVLLFETSESLKLRQHVHFRP